MPPNAPVRRARWLPGCGIRGALAAVARGAFGPRLALSRPRSLNTAATWLSNSSTARSALDSAADCELLLTRCDTCERARRSAATRWACCEAELCDLGAPAVPASKPCRDASKHAHTQVSHHHRTRVSNSTTFTRSDDPPNDATDSGAVLYRFGPRAALRCFARTPPPRGTAGTEPAPRLLVDRPWPRAPTTRLPAPPSDERCGLGAAAAEVARYLPPPNPPENAAMAANAERRGLRLHGTRGMVAIVSGHTGRSGGKIMQHRPPFKRSVCCWQLERAAAAHR